MGTYFIVMADSEQTDACVQALAPIFAKHGGEVKEVIGATAIMVDTDFAARPEIQAIPGVHEVCFPRKYHYCYH